MSRGATVAANNKFYCARKKASEKDERLSSRDEASELLFMDKTRLARIETNHIVPNSDEIMAMAELYETPELCNYYCAKCCPIGKENIAELDVSSFTKIALQILSACEDIEGLRTKLLAIAADGDIEDDESEDFLYVLDILNRFSIGAQSMMLWSKKNIDVSKK